MIAFYATPAQPCVIADPLMQSVWEAHLPPTGGFVVIAQPGDTPADIEQGIGLQIIEWGEPSWETIDDRNGIFAAVLDRCDDDGSACILLLPNDERINSALLALCHHT
ncbi:hypothetical protein [Sphingobium sp. WCS2017Hpa-17]|uniref:hypothetical protein n=1 Tax=Sphingobium sp. WCS2017Hpa-17 TaxID=3073638 RepID=UPI00288B9D81|nr:hypothetical protein [Sphingobium sp. WCS2017Hpa-17]